MTGQKTIHISSEAVNVNVVTEGDITPNLLRCLEKQLNAIVNHNLCHDLRGRITSINMSLHMLERAITPEARPRLQTLKNQIEDLSRIIEHIT